MYQPTPLPIIISNRIINHTILNKGEETLIHDIKSHLQDIRPMRTTPHPIINRNPIPVMRPINIMDEYSYLQTINI